ncbi:hypothetical protein NDU88_000959 [Pleurodeles waltl]|uniref:Uncharacterized protein n=1 Tax=Pleurodeles waltl TaxID=8319 RepID=A0AAV7WK33_PLEWA|nr:hypothetical protein NDU88_000959 [Pleurodeles waltl]
MLSTSRTASWPLGRRARLVFMMRERGCHCKRRRQEPEAPVTLRGGNEVRQANHGRRIAGRDVMQPGK